MRLSDLRDNSSDIVTESVTIYAKDENPSERLEQMETFALDFTKKYLEKLGFTVQAVPMKRKPSQYDDSAYSEARSIIFNCSLKDILVTSTTVGISCSKQTVPAVYNVVFGGYLGNIDTGAYCSTQLTTDLAAKGNIAFRKRFGK